VKNKTADPRASSRCANTCSFRCCSSVPPHYCTILGAVPDEPDVERACSGTAVVNVNATPGVPKLANNAALPGCRRATLGCADGADDGSFSPTGHSRALCTGAQQVDFRLRERNHPRTTLRCLAEAVNTAHAEIRRTTTRSHQDSSAANIPQ